MASTQKKLLFIDNHLFYLYKNIKNGASVDNELVVMEQLYNLEEEEHGFYHALLSLMDYLSIEELITVTDFDDKDELLVEPSFEDSDTYEDFLFEELEDLLRKAIADEDFEEASKIRDEINKRKQN
mgnify:CR=1 FL=1